MGVADLAVARADERARITTFALGSCIGLSVYDPVVRVGGLLHYMLPQPGPDIDPGELKVAMYATTGVPALFRKLELLGLRRERAVVCVAGGAEVLNDTAVFAIGQRNRTILRKIFWKDGTRVAAEDTGGNLARTMTIDLATGEVRIKTRAGERVLWSPARVPAGTGNRT
ncbi:MAG: chemotaxis protein CheD [Planctomycetota bacterium]